MEKSMELLKMEKTLVIKTYITDDGTRLFTLKVETGVPFGKSLFQSFEILISRYFLKNWLNSVFWPVALKMGLF